MKIVKEILYEKFEEESDPIEDMGIGIKHVREFDTFEEAGKFYVDYINILSNGIFKSKYDLMKYFEDIADFHGSMNHGYELRRSFLRACKDYCEGYHDGLPGIKIKNYSNIPFNAHPTKLQFLKYFRDAAKEYAETIMLREKFEETSDPIEDMGIGLIDISDEVQKIVIRHKKISQRNPEVPVYKYLDKFIGKKISGKFKAGFWARIKDAEFIIKDYMVQFFDNRTLITFYNYDIEDQNYDVMPGERYRVYGGVFEKFTEEGDPIDDMGIGMDTLIRDFMKNNVDEYLEDGDETTYNKDLLLKYCVWYQKKEFVDYLLYKGANINNIYMKDLFHHACAENDADVIKLLLDKKYDFHGDAGVGWEKGLRIAIANNSLDVVKLLVEAGANVNVVNGKPIRIALANKHTKILKYLIEKGVDIGKKDYINAATAGGPEMVDLVYSKIKGKRRKKIRNFFGLKESLYEKFSEEGDPIEDMGIGVKFVYYRLFKSDQHFYTMYIYGDSFNVRDILKRYNFKWDDQNRAWKSKFSLPKELWEKSAPKMFEEIETVGGHVVQPKGQLSKFDIDMERSFLIPGYEHSQYPPIPRGNGAKVYFKQWHHHAPIIGVVGKGSYIGKAALKYDGYRYSKESHMWENIYNKEDVDNLIEYFKSKGYEVIDGRKKVNEKFKEESDPIHDLGIGVEHLRVFNTFEEAAKHFVDNVNILSKGSFKSKEDIKYYLSELNQIGYANKRRKGLMQTCKDYCEGHDGEFPGIVVKEFSNKNFNHVKQYKLQFFKYFYDAVKLYTNQQVLHEKFEETSDPIEDMGIGGFSYKTLKPGAIIVPKKFMRFGTYSGKLVSSGGRPVYKQYPLLIINIVPIYNMGEKTSDKKFICVAYANEEEARLGRDKFLSGDALPLLQLKWVTKIHMCLKEKAFNNRFEIIEKGR